MSRRMLVRASALVLVSALLPRFAAAQAVQPEVPIDVSVKGQRSEARKLQESAEAVTVLDLRQAKQQSADLGEVLARTQGVSVRREGGLGSRALIALNGLQGEQVRTFVDGIPIELAGYPFGIVNIPVNIVERIEIYRGVVPVRFGLDALGGAINVVTTRAGRSYGSGSYQAGSYGIHRLNATGRYQHQGYVLGANLFADLAQNNFVMSDRQIMQADGTSVTKDVRRFHDAYHSYGGNLELGVVDKTWARRLLVKGFVSKFDSEIQHNQVMSVPYGEATNGELTYGAGVQYEVQLLPKLELEASFNYAYREISFRDMSMYRYRWTGEIARTLGTRGMPAYGEIRSPATDRETYEDRYLGRVGVTVPFNSSHALRGYVTPQLTSRTEHDFAPNKPNYDFNPRVLQVTTGIEYELSLFDGKLSNVLLGKNYLFRPTTEQLVERDGLAPFEFRGTRSFQYWGAGDSLRYRFTSWLLAKASYEYAIRMPTPDELFGNGVFVTINADLKPERSHNFNLGPRLEKRRTRFGDFVIDLNAFWRETQDQIVRIATSNFSSFQNLSDARSKGVEGQVWWQSPGQWVTLDTSFTRMDARNNSSDGPFAGFKGMRIPSRPYRFASWGGRFHLAGLPKSDDTLDFFYAGRHVNGFYRGWAIGNPEYKMSVPNQTAHSVGVTHNKVFREQRYSFTFEVDNLTNAKLYDVWGVQRPGRAFNVKIAGHL